jgi:hypothetical protein
LSKIVPSDERSDAHRWAGSGEPRTMPDKSSGVRRRAR